MGRAIDKPERIVTMHDSFFNADALPAGGAIGPEADVKIRVAFKVDQQGGFAAIFRLRFPGAGGERRSAGCSKKMSAIDAEHTPFPN